MSVTCVLLLITSLASISINEAAGADCSTLVIKSRGDWGSTVINTAVEVPKSPGMIFIGQTGGASCSNFAECSVRVREIQQDDLKRPGSINLVPVKITVTIKYSSDICSHFLIGGDGAVYEGRGWHREGRYPPSYKSELGIAFIGDFSNATSVPQIMLNTVRQFILCGINKRRIQYFFSAYTLYDLPCETMPENNTLVSEVKKWSRYRMGGPLDPC